MGADAVVVFFGNRFVVSDAELEAVERRTDDRLIRARMAKLHHRAGRETEGRPHHLFIGHEFGVFGTENAVRMSLSPAEIQRVCDTTRQRLAEAGFTEVPAFHIQLEADH